MPESCAAIGLGVLCARSARAQQRPLTTEDPEVDRRGRLLVEAGVESGSNAWYSLSGLNGDRVRHARGCQRRARPLSPNCSSTPATLVRHRQPGRRAAGVSRAGRRHAHLRRHRRDGGDEDAHAAPRAAGRPSIGVRFETRLPNASNESGLGLDTTDFFFSILGRRRRSAHCASSATRASAFWATRSSRRSSQTPSWAACPSRAPSPGRRRRRRGQRPGGVVRGPCRRLAPSRSEKSEGRALHARAAAVRRRRAVWLHGAVT